MKPEVSIIVPARDAETTLPRLLAALERSTFTGERELIVVDDASSDRTGALAEAAGARVVRLDGQGGPAVARNAGLQAARAPLIAFTDADCQPSPQWLDAIVTALRDGAGVVRGPVRPDPEAPLGPFDRTLWVGEESPLFETANLGVTRAVADAVGGFRPFSPARDAARGLRPRVDQGHFGEDVVFGWRARGAGAAVVYAERALVHHSVFARGPGAYVREHWRMRFFPALVGEVPELRDALPARYFLSRRTAAFDLAVLGLLVALTMRRRWPALAVAPYAARRLAWRHEAVRHNAAFVAADAVGLAALVRGSIAARRLLI